MKHRHLGSIFAIGAAAIAITSFSSCNKTEEKAQPNIPFEFQTFVGGGTFTLKGSASQSDNDSDMIYSDSVSLLMPQVLGSCDVTELRDSILSIALDIKGKPVDKAVEQWVADMAKAQEFTPEKLNDNFSVGANGVDIVSGYVANLNPKSLVYAIYYEGYTPGANHGIYGRRYINYSLEGKGTIITLEKLFTPEGLKELPVRIAKQAATMADNIGQTEINALPSDGNFYLSSEDEIVFSYQPYEAASYAQGIINIPFYPYELAEYMTPYGIQLFDLQDLSN